MAVFYSLCIDLMALNLFLCIVQHSTMYQANNQIEKSQKSEDKSDLEEVENIWNTEEIGILRKNLIKIKEDNFQLKSQLAVAIEENKRLREKLEKITNETKNLPDEVKSLEKTNERLYIRVQDMESRYAIYVAEMENLENSIKQFRENEQSLKSKIQECNSEKLKLDLENKRLNIKLESCKNELKNYFMEKCENYKLKYLKQINKLENKLTESQDLLHREKEQHEKCKKGLDHLRTHFMYAFVPGENYSRINEKNISPL
ncbi:leucine zipper tumor suppressor 1-like [Brachionus plicatilis]|uniref:Leucine zipper tumor suppressor 1-like n=1 Tax=Brachionus plicatilis TaxID=10195 RepID=A0A3M7SUA1_BRAPC|nr:leucine zipper tumor suppressor 1-like [Brachionus plicatilis]